MDWAAIQEAPRRPRTGEEGSRRLRTHPRATPSIKNSGSIPAMALCQLATGGTRVEMAGQWGLSSLPPTARERSQLPEDVLQRPGPGNLAFRLALTILNFALPILFFFSFVD